MNPHTWKQYGPDEVGCIHCGAEPHHRPTSCPGPHRSRVAQHVGGGGLAATKERMRRRPR